jgi:hypothetical protein
MTQAIYTMANKTTPPDVTVPETWTGVIVWALGKWGVGAVFMVMVYFLYLDLRASNDRFARLVEANTTAIHAFAQQVSENHSKVNEMKSTVSSIVKSTESILLEMRKPNN